MNIPLQSPTVPLVPVPADPAAPIRYTRTRCVPVQRKHLHSEYLIAGLDPCGYLDAFKVLRTRVLQRLNENGWNTLAVTSPNAGVGKSLVAANLALSLALEVSRTVLLVDANLREPDLHRRFGIRPEFGVGDHLLDGVPVEKLLIHPEGIDRFVLLPGHRAVPGSAELLSAPAMAGLVHELKHRYPDRIVIFDLPHLQTADALAFAPLADALLLVAGAGRTGLGELAEALDHLHGLSIIGTVLNGAEFTNDH